MESTLPEMGYRLGIYSDTTRAAVIKSLVDFEVDPEPFYPSKPILSKEDWKSILDYYEHRAPDALQAAPQSVKIGLKGFSVRESQLRFNPPYTTDVRIYDAYNAYSVSNYAVNNQLVLLDQRDRLMYEFELEGAVTDTEIEGSTFWVSVVGPGPEPTAGRLGALYGISDPNVEPLAIAENLMRPVDIELGDIDNDGLNDFVVCEYGHFEGNLAWYKNVGDGTYKRHVLHSTPGAIKATLQDLDGDGLLDIVALIAQGDEGVDVYINQGDGAFRYQRVLRFPPVYGSTGLELHDFNNDGRADILYSNGDNADSSPIPKPYHGVRIFLASSPTSFEERFFYPLPGAMSAQAGDFDEDGDLDIAAISYFPDYSQEFAQSFVVLENQDTSILKFAYSTFMDSQRGRWLVMDVGDMDGDNDLDILLGSNIGFDPKGDETNLFDRWSAESISTVILENTLRSN